MQIIKPGFAFEDEVDSEKILKNIERYGRTCYKSEEKITPDSAKKFIAGLLKNGHESVIEHEKVTVRVVCDRGVTHEIVRHRLASYSQESTRYCNYQSHGIKVVEPIFFSRTALKKTVKFPTGGYLPDGAETIELRLDAAGNFNEFDVWFYAMLFAEWAYNTLINDFGRSPQEARSVLPNSLKTEIVITYNLREWRHFFKLRTSKKAHPQMREITIPMLQEFKQRIPVIFDDITAKE